MNMVPESKAPLDMMGWDSFIFEIGAFNRPQLFSLSGGSFGMAPPWYAGQLLVISVDNLSMHSCISEHCIGFLALQGLH